MLPSNIKAKRIRLIYSARGSPLGMCGELITFEENFHAIIWDNLSIEFRDSIESDTFFVDTIIEGYSLLTMDDVLSITYEDYRNLKRINDRDKVLTIIREYLDFTKVFQKRNYQEFSTEIS